MGSTKTDVYFCIEARFEYYPLLTLEELGVLVWIRARSEHLVAAGIEFKSIPNLKIRP